jgi:glycerate 2-kinase
MKVICAPDKFKGSLTAAEAAQAMARGVRRAAPSATVDCCPVADGGEGLVEAMLAAASGQPVFTKVASPLGDRVSARWGLIRERNGEPLTAVMEMAAASGLALVPPDRRDPTRTTTFGTGQLIRAAMDHDVERIIIGIGGSATTDGGCGAAAALGVRFIDASGQTVGPESLNGGRLADITRIDTTGLDPRLANTPILVACDVTNPLVGPLGAACVYGPQKGATPAQVMLLDQGLRHLAAVIREQLAMDVETMPGAGAAGGLGAGLVAFLGGVLWPGIDLVLEATGFDRRVRGCDLCLSGEGRLDGQTAAGKAVIGVARAALRQGVKTVALVGALGDGAEAVLEAGLHAYQVIGRGLGPVESQRRAAELLEAASANLIAAWPR